MEPQAWLAENLHHIELKAKLDAEQQRHSALELCKAARQCELSMGFAEALRLYRDAANVQKQLKLSRDLSASLPRLVRAAEESGHDPFQELPEVVTICPSQESGRDVTELSTVLRRCATVRLSHVVKRLRIEDGTVLSVQVYEQIVEEVLSQSAVKQSEENQLKQKLALLACNTLDSRAIQLENTAWLLKRSSN